MHRSCLLLAVIVSSSVLGACGGASTPADQSSHAIAPQPTPQTAASEAPKKFSPAEVFPPGPGRDLVLGNCGSCHSLLCGARVPLGVEVT